MRRAWQQRREAGSAGRERPPAGSDRETVIAALPSRFRRAAAGARPEGTVSGTRPRRASWPQRCEAGAEAGSAGRELPPGGSESGQALVVTVLFMTVLLGMAAAVLDVGAWYRQHRQLQTTADAAALAGAQALPTDPGGAVALAVEYGDKNGGGVAAGNVTLSGDTSTSEIAVTAKKPTPGIFTKLFGIDSVEIEAKAKARVGLPGKARYAAPIAVDERHPLLSGNGCPCFGETTTLDLQKVGPGAFRLINLDESHGGTGPSTLADWILNGFDGYMPLNWYFSDPGAKFNASQIRSAMQARIGDELLFPVYSDTRQGGANFEYYVIGWVAFHLTGFTAQGNGGTVTGSFERVIWEGIHSEAADEESDFGTRVVQLVE